MKKCFKCNVTKPLEEFYKHSEMADGHLNKCKECNKLDVRRHRQNSPRPREYDKERWKKDESRRKRQERNTKKWRIDFPEKYKAQTKLNNAVRDGKIKRMPCEICGLKAHGHHEDYSKPLEVKWLCASHHQFLHQHS